MSEGCRIHGDTEPSEKRQERIEEARRELAAHLDVPVAEVEVQTIRREYSVLLNAVWLPPWRVPEAATGTRNLS